MDSTAQVSDHDILLGLRPIDWEYLHGLEPVLASLWCKALGLHPKSVIFGPNFGPFLAARVAHKSSGKLSLAVATLKRELHIREAHADDVGAFREALPERIRQILDLPTDRYPTPEWFVHDCGHHAVPDHEDAAAGEPSDEEADAVDAEADCPELDAFEEGHADVHPEVEALGMPPRSLAETAGLLEELYEPLLGSVVTLLDELTAGKRPAADCSADVAAWSALWAGLPADVGTLSEARASADAASSEAHQLAADRALLADLVGLGFPDGSARAVAKIAEIQDQATRAALPLSDDERSGFAALLRALHAEWPADSDVETITGWFGPQVLMAANKLTPAPAQETTISVPPDPVTETVPLPVPLPEEPAAEIAEDDPVELAEPDTVQVADTVQVPEVTVDEPVVGSVPETLLVEPAAVVSAAETAPVTDTVDTVKGEPSAEKGEIAQANAEQSADYLPRFEAAAAAGEFGWAYWYAVAGRGEARARAARLLALATSSDMTVGSPNARANGIAAQLEQDLVDASAAVSETIAAALVPAALLLPPYSEATLSLNAAAGRLGEDCPAFIRIANTLTYERGSGLHTVEAPLLLAARDQARADLEKFREQAASRTIRFQRATEVWRELIRQQGLLGSLALRALDGPINGELRRSLADVEERGIDRIIKDTDQQLNPGQAKRQGIIAGAKQELTGRIQRYLDLIRACVATEESVRAIAAGIAHNTDLIEELIGSLPVDPAAQPGFGCVAVGVARWLRARLVPNGAVPVPVAEAAVVARPLVAAFELDRRADGEFDHGQVSVALLEALRGRSVEAAFVGYVERHDYVGLEALLDMVRAENPVVAGQLEERERRARAESRESLQRALERTRVGLSRALSVTSLSEAEAQEYLDKVERVARDVSPHFREALGTLAQIDGELASRHQGRLDQAAKQLAGLSGVDEAARARVAGLLESRDLLSAEEFLAQLSNGATSLPEEDEGDRTLEAFWRVVAAAEPAGPRWFAERLAEGRVDGLPFPHPSAPLRVRDGLTAWERLAREGRPQGFDQMLREVLGAVGFQPVTLGQKFSPGRATSFNVFEARYDGYALIPTFGSAARGQYAIFLCWERKSVDGLLQAVRAAQEGLPRPTVVLYFQTLKPAERRQLAEQCRRKGLPNIVIDHAAMAYLGTREEARLDALMHVCLPFTGSNPYTPFVLGDVPREMFYGRTDELRAVQDPHGPLFVYGGRQLGKSALLKTAMSEFGRFDEHHVSIYLDLKAEGIGEWHKADDLWRVLLPRLQDKGVVSERVSRQATPEVVAGQVAEWLAAEPRRHLLLLLDESDAFLDQDARPRAGGGQFKNVYTLKNLMTQSERRFKPVFAGLHQVQRFHKESNGPMAHVGTEIPVGPLPPAEAYKLVVRPLEAIGYRFTSADVAWRLLSHTNYQASLIQLFCKELVNDLRVRRLGLAEPPSMIDEATVDRVYENKELRGQIAQRFDWTIQLDNRYRVIALVAAWLNLADAETVASVSLLRAQCADFWPAGFDGVTPDEFRALLDEMVGLGVLVRNPQDHYGIRSPNVIRLLGSKDEIERKLMESSSMELPTVFDPARYRRKLADQTRSPITEAQAARMLVNASQPTVVTASAALGADRLAAALTEIAKAGEGVELHLAGPADLTVTLTKVLRLRQQRHLLFDARGIDRHGLTEALAKLGKATRTQSRFTVSVLLDPADRARLDVPEADVREVTLGPWTDVELRAVEPEADIPLNVGVRSQLFDLTGGWPDVLDQVLTQGRRTDVTAMLAFAEAEADGVVSRGWPAMAARIGVLRGGVEEKVLTTLLDWEEPLGRDDLADLLPPWEPQRLTDTLNDLARCGAVQTVGAPNPQAVPALRVNPLVARTMRAAR